MMISRDETTCVGLTYNIVYIYIYIYIYVCICMCMSVYKIHNAREKERELMI